MSTKEEDQHNKQWDKWSTLAAEEKAINRGERGKCDPISFYSLAETYIPKIIKLQDVETSSQRNMFLGKVRHHLFAATIATTKELSDDEYAELPPAKKKDLLTLAGQLQRHSINKDIADFKREQLLIAAHWIRLYLYQTHLKIDKYGHRVQSA
jgi:hypothetical protein